jgi:hypothetical protein
MSWRNRRLSPGRILSCSTSLTQLRSGVYLSAQGESSANDTDRNSATSLHLSRVESMCVRTGYRPCKSSQVTRYQQNLANLPQSGTFTPNWQRIGSGWITARLQELLPRNHCWDCDKGQSSSFQAPRPILAGTPGRDTRGTEIQGSTWSDRAPGRISRQPPSRQADERAKVHAAGGAHSTCSRGSSSPPAL